MTVTPFHITCIENKTLWAENSITCIEIEIEIKTTKARNKKCLLQANPRIHVEALKDPQDGKRRYKEHSLGKILQRLCMPTAS
jgi:hypothetical protein